MLETHQETMEIIVSALIGAGYTDIDSDGAFTGAIAPDGKPISISVNITP